MAQILAEPMHRSPGRDVLSDLVGLLLVVVSPFVFAALMSYSPKDLPAWVPFYYTSLPNDIPVNLLGRTGAVLAGFLLFSLGAGAFVVTALVFVMGLAKLIAPRFRFGGQLPWVVGVAVSAACFAQVQSWWQTDWPSQNNLDGAGGWLGYWLGERFIAVSLGATAMPIFGLIYLWSLFRLFRLTPWGLVFGLMKEFDAHQAEQKRRRLNRATPQERLTIEGRELEKYVEQQKRILERHGVSEPTSSEVFEEETLEPEYEPLETEAEMSLDTPPSGPVEVTPLPRPGRTREPLPAKPPPPPKYILPDSSFLTEPEPSSSFDFEEQEAHRLRDCLVDTLAEFKVIVSPGEITRGPTVTRIELYPAEGVRVDRIVALEKDLARATKAERINILAPVPGKDTVGIELANQRKVRVGLRELLEDRSWDKKKYQIPLPIGKDIYGQTVVKDLALMPHLLVAGATGSGKSVAINTMLVSLLMRFSPDDLKLLLIDPKVVEMQIYNGLPHLISPVITDPRLVVGALQYVVKEMEFRYELFGMHGVKNIAGYNRDLVLQQKTKGKGKRSTADQLTLGLSAASAPAPERLPYVVVIIDELSDLMQTAAAQMQGLIVRITQKARAAGIHLIVATQSPRVEVITGLIKSNIPCRMAFQTASRIDSKVILDAQGAEKLLGQGDLLFSMPGAASGTIRAQGAYVSEEELQEVVEFVCRQREADYLIDLNQPVSSGAGGDADLSPEDQELVLRATDILLVLASQEKGDQRARTSQLQSKLRIGHGRATRIMDELERLGYVGPNEANKGREILLDGLPNS